MQPLYSVDHETRHSTNNAEVQHDTTESTENSPLLRFPEHQTPRNPLTTVIVSLLLLVLIAGVIIGIYLLVLQNASENVLPPVVVPLQLVSRSQWDQSNNTQANRNFFPYKLKEAIVVQTYTPECVNTETCVRLLQDMQANATASKNIMPYNFLISSNGQAYEALGWQMSSPMLTQKQSEVLVLAFIGNFSNVPPSKLQMQEAKIFFEESVSHQYMDTSYSILGKNVNDTPPFLCQSLKEFPEWRNEFLDNKKI